jgi:hypothetical protein
MEVVTTFPSWSPSWLLEALGLDVASTGSLGTARMMALELVPQAGDWGRCVRTGRSWPSERLTIVNEC